MWAGRCEMDRGSLRPNAGQVFINLKYAPTDPSVNDMELIISSLMHEMTHILVMSNTLYKYY